MESPWQTLASRLQALGTHWPMVTVLGSFVLYVLGYLTLRFHLSALGIGTDLAVLDERYLFTGVKFLIYLFTTLPSVLLIVLVLATPFYGIYLLLPTGCQTYLRCCYAGVKRWWQTNNRLPWLGIGFSLLMIQLFMRKCFDLGNLLLASELPPTANWLKQLVLADTDGPMALYFCALGAGAGVTTTIFYQLNKTSPADDGAVLLKPLLVLLLSLQWLLIPVNYGILVVDKDMPQVSGLHSANTLKDNQQAWLVWEGNTGITFFLREQQGGKYRKSLITLPRAAVNQVEIVAYDRIFQVLFDLPQPQSKARP